jgi:hypothetical protein
MENSLGQLFEILTALNRQATIEEQRELRELLQL